jgi:hypothetical protein
MRDRLRFRDVALVPILTRSPIHSMLRSLIRAAVFTRPRPSALRRGQRQRLNCGMPLGEIGIQSRQVPAQRLCRVRRTRHQRGMDAACAHIRAHANPAKGRILKPRFGPLRADMNPRVRTRGGLCIESSKGLGGGRPGARRSSGAAASRTDCPRRSRGVAHRVRRSEG